MTQRLKLIKHEKQGNSHFAIYKFGLTETLFVHSDGNADICDRDTGACIRPLGWDGIKNMGYCPNKLAKGNRYFQLDNDLIKDNAKGLLTVVFQAFTVFGLMASAYLLVSQVTGCSQKIGNQFDKDMATSTTIPRLNNDELIINDIDSQALMEFRKQNAHANKMLASYRASTKAEGEL